MSDLIKRQDAIDVIEKLDIPEDMCVFEILSHIELAIGTLPPAERKGKWIRHTRVEPVYSIDGVETWGIKCQCNKCCFTTTVVEDFGYYNYCPNCGADMRLKGGAE